MSIFRKDGNSIINPNRGAGGERPRVLFKFPRDSFRQGLGAGSLGLGKKYRELVPTGPTRNVRPANGLEAGAGDTAQDFVPCGVPVSIIYAFECAEVKREQR